MQRENRYRRGRSRLCFRRDIEGVRRAIQIINTITEDPEVGALYKGKVTRLMNFGAFVEIAPGKGGGAGAYLQARRQAREKVEDW